MNTAPAPPARERLPGPWRFWRSASRAGGSGIIGGLADRYVAAGIHCKESP